MNIRLKSILISLLCLLLLAFCGCDADTNSIDEGTSSSSVDNLDDNSALNDVQSKSSSSSDDDEYSYSVKHYCEAEGCYKEGTNEYIGLYGTTEYYCDKHYQEIMDTLSDMEKDVGNGSYSKHTCEVCDKEGTYSIIGFSGEKEYYCSEHYYEMKDLLDSLYE